MATANVDSVKNVKAKKSDNASDDDQASGGVDIKKLLEAGAHFGHKTSRWHPKMAPFIHSKRNGTHIIDLTKTVERLENALKFIEDTTASGKQVLLVGTKRQAQEIIRKLAVETEMPFVVDRWLGGMLTNRPTMGDRIKHLKDLEAKMENGQLAAKYNKLEVQRFQEEIDEMNVNYGGIKNMAPRPGAILVVDVVHDANAVREAKKLKIPTVGVVDTNADPTGIQYPVPCNDDAIKTIQLLADYFKQAIDAGKARHQKGVDKDADKETGKQEQ
ncbi:30S ribosomal protein S2 [soil metagenome]